MKAQRIGVLLVPRWESCSQRECVNGGRILTSLAKEEWEDLVAIYPESETPELTPVSSVSPVLVK